MTCKMPVFETLLIRVASSVVLLHHSVHVYSLMDAASDFFQHTSCMFILLIHLSIYL